MSEREWWIEFGGSPIDDKECYKRYVSGTPITTPYPDCEIIHVIEKSAYDQLKAKCDAYEQALERYARAAHYCEGDAAFDVLTKYRGSE